MSALFYVALVVGLIAAYGTHLIWAVHTLASEHAATAGQIVLSVAGTFLPPIGVVHVFVLWFS